tara:strand:+ start:308 stop:520 length:213 start_codon:yes stop_codon:yes gene_type:complete
MKKKTKAEKMLTYLSFLVKFVVVFVVVVVVDFVVVLVVVVLVPALLLLSSSVLRSYLMKLLDFTIWIWSL